MNSLDVYKAILGDKKFDVIEYIVANADEFGLFMKTITNVCLELDISKPTVIETFKLLESKNVLVKIKNGVYKLNIPR